MDVYQLRRRIRGQDSDGDGGAGERTRGRPKGRWLDNIRNNLSERELSGEETQDLANWRRPIRNIDPHIIVEKDAEVDDSHTLYVIVSSTRWFITLYKLLWHQ